MIWLIHTGLTLFNIRFILVQCIKKQQPYNTLPYNLSLSLSVKVFLHPQTYRPGYTLLYPSIIQCQSKGPSLHPGVLSGACAEIMNSTTLRTLAQAGDGGSNTTIRSSNTHESDVEVRHEQLKYECKPFTMFLSQIKWKLYGATVNMCVWGVFI